MNHARYFLRIHHQYFDNFSAMRQSSLFFLLRLVIVMLQGWSVTNSLLQLLGAMLDTFRWNKGLYYCLKPKGIEYVAPDRIWYFSYSYHYNKNEYNGDFLQSLCAFKVRVRHWIIPRNCLCIGSFGFRAVSFAILQPNGRFQASYAPRMIDSALDMLAYRAFALRFTFKLCALFRTPLQ